MGIPFPVSNGEIPILDLPFVSIEHELGSLSVLHDLVEILELFEWMHIYFKNISWWTYILKYLPTVLKGI